MGDQLWQSQFSSLTTRDWLDMSQRPQSLELGRAPLPSPTRLGRVSGAGLAGRGAGLQGRGVSFGRGRGGPMNRAARTGVGSVRGCGALRGGGRWQKRASRGLPVGAARSWPRDWLRYSRVRRLLSSGRAPRPRARRPLTARYVLARRLRCGARASRARRRRRLRAESPGRGDGGVLRPGRASTCPARPPALGECAARPPPLSLAARAPIPVTSRASRGTPAAACCLARGGDTVADVLAGEAAARPGQEPPPCSRSLRRNARGIR